MSSRFPIFDYPPAAPGVCFFCNSSQNGPFADTGRNVQFYGAVYVCQACVAEISASMPAKEENTYTLAEVLRWKQQLVEDVLSAVEDLQVRLGVELRHGQRAIVDRINSTLPVADSGSELVASVDDAGAEEDDGESDSVAVEDDESVSSEGASGVSSDPDDGDSVSGGLNPRPFDFL